MRLSLRVEQAPVGSGKHLGPKVGFHMFLPVRKSLREGSLQDPRQCIAMGKGSGHKWRMTQMLFLWACQEAAGPVWRDSGVPAICSLDAGDMFMREEEGGEGN